MPNLLNGLVNGWVKVNSKHVIFPREDANRRERKDSEAGASLDGSSGSHRGGVLDRSRGKSRTKQSHHSSTTNSSTGPSTADVDPEALAIKKFNSKRQNKRGLQRTISHSDLLREMANERGTRPRDHAANSRTNSHNSNTSCDRWSDQSVRLVAGFFGSEVEEKEMEKPREMNGMESRPTHGTLQNNGPVTTGKYLNEELFVWQLKQAKAGRQSSNESSTAGSSAASAQSPTRDGNGRLVRASDSNNAHREQECRHRGRETHHSLRRQHSGQVVKEDEPSKRSHVRQNHRDNNHSQCTGCNEMESQLLTAYDDIRYLRDVSLRNEFSKPIPSRPKDSLLHGNNRDPSKRLGEITGRHRRQIEQMTRESSRKQQDIHFKHSKMSMICKTLNDESSIRRQEALALEEEVRELMLERDKLATEVQRLRTEASLHKQEEREHALLRKQMTTYENHSLGRAENAVRERDEMIGNLSSKLERTLETLEIEREQQRQRRQIIFPGQKTSRTHQTESSSIDVAALQSELRKAKEAAKASEASLEASRKAAAEREIALTVRCEHLESRLNSMSTRQDES